MICVCACCKNKRKEKKMAFRYESEHVIKEEQPYIFYFLKYYYEFLHGEPPANRNSKRTTVPFDAIKPIVETALGSDFMSKEAPTDKTKGRATALFMFWWFVALTVVMLSVLLPNIIYRAHLGTYDLVLTSHGEDLWLGGARQAPVVLVSVCVLPILTMGPLIYFAVKGFQQEKFDEKAMEKDNEERDPLLLPNVGDTSSAAPMDNLAKSYTHPLSYLIFWICTSFTEAWMFWLAGGACGICEVFVLVLGSISVLGSFFILSRLNHADRPLYQGIAAIISLPVPVTIFSAAATFQSGTSAADLAAAYIYGAQYMGAVGVLLYLSNADRFAFYIHDRVYAVSAHLYHSKMRNFFLDLLEGKLPPSEDNVDGAHQVPLPDNVNIMATRKKSAKLAYDLLTTPVPDQDDALWAMMRSTARVTLRLWIPHLDEHLPTKHSVRKWTRIWAAAFGVVAIVVGIMSIPGLDLSATLNVNVTHSNCETFVDSWTWPGGRVMFPVSTGVVSLALLIGSFFSRFIDRIYSEVRFQIPVSWRQFLTGVIYACLSIIVAAAVGVTDVYLISMLGMCNLVAGFVMQRLQPYRDWLMTVVGYSCALIPWITCVAYTYLTHASPSRMVLAYVNLGCAMVWIFFHLFVRMRWCLDERGSVYRVLEFLSSLMVLLQTIVIITITWSHDLLRS
jgi:hypothetical protein